MIWNPFKLFMTNKDIETLLSTENNREDTNSPIFVRRLLLNDSNIRTVDFKSSDKKQK